MKTPEQIAQLTESKEGLANIRAINKLFREQDESHLYPIRCRFNATERAIRKAREYMHDSEPVYGLEYSLLLDTILSEIVNSEV